MTITSTLGGIFRPSPFVRKVMESTRVPGTDTKLTDWLLTLTLRCVELLARRTTSVEAMDTVLKAVNAVMVQLTAAKTEQRERLLLDMADQQNRLSHYREDGGVKVMDYVNGVSRDYKNVAEVIKNCESSSSLAEFVVIQFHPGQLILTLDLKIGRVVREITDDVYIIDFGNRTVQEVAAKDLVMLSNEPDNTPIIFDCN